MVDMPDYAHPWQPNLTVNANALTQFQSYMDNQRLAADQRSAGGLAATGDYAGAQNQLMGQGHMAEAIQMRAIARQVNQDKLADIKDTYTKLGNLARSHLDSPNRSPAQWAQAIAAAKSHGLKTDGFEDPATGPQMLIAMSDQTGNVIEDEQKRRAAEVSAMNAKFKGATTYGATIPGAEGEEPRPATVMRLPSGEWTPPIATPKGVDTSSPIGGTDKDHYAGIKVGGNPLTGEGGSVLVLNKATGEITKPKIPSGVDSETGEPLYKKSSAEGTAPIQPSAAWPLPVAERLPGVKGTTSGPEVEGLPPINDKALEGLSEGWRSRIQAWSEGREKIPNNSRDQTTQAAISKLYEYNPGFNRANQDQYFRYREQFMNANGKRQNEGISFNTATNHAANAINASDWLPTGSKLSTSPQMWWADFKNDPKLSKLQANIGVLAGEATKIVHGGESVETEKKFRELMDPSKGKEAFQAGVAAVMQAMIDKSQEIEQNWALNMRNIKMPPEVHDISVMTPTARKRLDEMKEKLIKSGNLALPEGWAKEVPKVGPGKFKWNPATNALEAVQ